jgi:hypothetical protein
MSLEQINKKKLIPPFKPNLLKYNFDDTEFADAEMDDLLLIFNEKEDGDLVLPLFRRFYYESGYMKELKGKLSEDPDKRSISHTTSDTVVRKLSGLRLRTEQDFRQRYSTSKRQDSRLENAVGANELVRKPLLSRKLSNSSNRPIKLDKTESSLKKHSQLNSSTRNLAKIYKNTTVI